jgi:signal transduction histidine kinase
MEKIFEKFFRTNNNESGNGLGLNIAHTIAKLHKGDIEVDSKLGHGTTFRITLPLA